MSFYVSVTGLLELEHHGLFAPLAVLNLWTITCEWICSIFSSTFMFMVFDILQMMPLQLLVCSIKAAMTT